MVSSTSDTRAALLCARAATPADRTAASNAEQPTAKRRAAAVRLREMFLNIIPPLVRRSAPTPSPVAAPRPGRPLRRRLSRAELFRVDGVPLYFLARDVESRARPAGEAYEALAVNADLGLGEIVRVPARRGFDVRRVREPFVRGQVQALRGGEGEFRHRADPAAEAGGARTREHQERLAQSPDPLYLEVDDE